VRTAKRSEKALLGTLAEMYVPGNLIAIVIGCGIAATIVWLALGSRILLVVDRFFPGRPSTQETGDLLLDPDRFSIASRWHPLSGSLPFQLIVDSRQRMVFYSDGRAFTFGPIQKMWTDPVKPQYLFVPEPSDVVSFTRDVSRLSWQTPFAFSVLPSYRSKIHRYAYDRLRWSKPSGSTLEMVWRDEQSRYPSQWADGYNDRLIRVTIQLSPIEKAVATYIARAKRWAANQYRLEIRPAIAEDEIVAAIYLQDEIASHPGGGKSVILRVNKSSGKVVGESGFQ